MSLLKIVVLLLALVVIYAFIQVSIERQERTPSQDELAKYREHFDNKNLQIEKSVGIYTVHGAVTPLCVASYAGNIEKIKALVEAGHCVNQLSHHDEALLSPLYLAARKGHLEAVRFLLQKGADKDFVSGKERKSILAIAAENGHKDVIVALLEEGFAPSFNELRSAYDAQQDEIVRILIENIENEAPLFGGKNCDGNTLLHCSILDEKEEIAQALIQKSSEQHLKVVSRKGHTPLYQAIIKGQFSIIDRLIQKKAHDTAPHLLCAAVEVGNIEVGKRLVQAAVQIDQVPIDDSSDFIPLSPLITAYLKNKTDFVEYLLEKGADVNAYDAVTTLLGHAVARKDASFALRLLQTGKIDLAFRPQKGYLSG